MATARKSSFELLRIIAMLQIIAWHYASQGGLLGCGNEGVRAAATVLGMSGRWCVNVFLVMGTWFMVDAKFDLRRIFRLYLTVLFYSVVLTAVMLAAGEAGGGRNIFQGLCPFFGRSVWFASAYLSLIALSPFLNKAFLLPERPLRRLVGLLFVLYCVVATIPCATPNEYLSDFTWFAVVYIIVGWLKRGKVLDMINSRWFSLLIPCAVYAAVCAGLFLPAARPLAGYWLDNIKCLPAFAFGLLLFNFARLSDIGHVGWINRAAKSAFAVYVIHQVPAFRHFEWSVLCRADAVASLPPWQCGIAIAGVSVAVFAAASLADALCRRFVIAPLERAFGISKQKGQA